MPAPRQLLDLADALGLDLVQGLPAGQAHVVHALGVGDPQPGPLASSQEQRPDPVLGDVQQAFRQERRVRLRVQGTAFLLPPPPPTTT